MARVYLDSCIVIYLIQASGTTRERVQTALSLDGDLQLFVSNLTRLECRVWPLREQAVDVLAAFDRFFASRDLERIELDRPVFDLATELRAELRLKTPDALHAAAAIHGGCDEFWTNDHRLTRALESRIKVQVLP